MDRETRKHLERLDRELEALIAKSDPDLVARWRKRRAERDRKRQEEAECRKREAE